MRPGKLSKNKKGSIELYLFPPQSQCLSIVHMRKYNSWSEQNQIVYITETNICTSKTMSKFGPLEKGSMGNL